MRLAESDKVSVEVRPLFKIPLFKTNAETCAEVDLDAKILMLVCDGYDCGEDPSDTWFMYTE